MRVNELGLPASDQDITRERDLETGGDRKTPDRTDDRLPAPLHLDHGVGVGILDVALEHLLGRRQVDAGAERAAPAGKDDDADRLVGVQALDRAGEVGDHRLGQRV